MKVATVTNDDFWNMVTRAFDTNGGNDIVLMSIPHPPNFYNYTTDIWEIFAREDSSWYKSTQGRKALEQALSAQVKFVGLISLPPILDTQRVLSMAWYRATFRFRVYDTSWIVQKLEQAASISDVNTQPGQPLWNKKDG